MPALPRARTPLATLLALVLAATLLGNVLAPEPAAARPTHYVQMSDGVLIAVNVDVPEHCTADSPCPTVLEMAGYENGSADGRTPMGDLADRTGADFLPLQCGSRCSHSVFFEAEYVTIQASVRGSGCSTGEFDLFSWRSALDGRELIDSWIVQQPWSNGDVAIFGHSYSGLTGTLVAATQPKHLRVLSVSGLIDDLYRGIVYPGGVTNYGFPLLWTGAVRPLYDVGGGFGGGMFPDPDPACAQNQAEKSRTLLNDPLVQGLADTDNDWYRARSLVTWVERLNVPTHITGAYQDEQTGPRGPAHLFERLPAGISRRLLLTNGVHGTQTEAFVRQDRLAWIDYWMRGAGEHDAFDAPLDEVFGPRDTVTSSARTILGYLGDGKYEGLVDSADYPHNQTEWKNLWVSGDERLRFDLDDVAAADLPWFNGSRRQAYSYQAGVNEGAFFSAPTGPDELELRHRFEEDTVIAGPMSAKLRISSTAPDTELFVQLVDRAPGGEMLYLQRGMLRASHRAVLESLSDKTPDGRIYRPWRPHTQPELLTTPGEPVDYLIEVFPVGHVFRAGHELVVKVHAPPIDDNDYMYVPKTPPSVNTLHVDPKHPSYILLPVIPLGAVAELGSAPAPCAYHRMRCVKP